ncbi:MAG: murein biosynthesis integral membrane protein MurJ, partial [Peptoniphilus grossensis]|uniref:murein biosynthesis integral membrane protein MurJ n=1 Tax=Peptoniphilus grossensis TaxID=1465756 RepID=UPI002588083D|nr:murein biosynthesis integral membrane protein MurJ [Peptoniphilus grossensis]MDU5100360.1 murein biosynthesis integral membrane protein MurJ [Peptoniphilus grossensis]
MKTSYILMVITIISKIFGLLREKALAYFFGVGMVADIFLIAFQLPMTFTNVISGAVANGYIPMYDKIKEREDKKRADLFTANLSNIILIVFIIVTILSIIFARPLVKLMAEGFEGEKLETAIFVSRVAMLSIAVTAVSSIFKAYLQIHEKFITSVLHSILMNVILIGAMAISRNLGINYLAIGILLAFVLQYGIFILPIKKLGYRHRLKVDFNEDMKAMFVSILPILISTSAIEINFMISRSLASGAYAGGISILNYAYKLQSFVTGIVVTSIITATYPKLANFGSKKDYVNLKSALSEGLSNMLLLVVPAAFGLYIFSFPIVNLLFVGGEFSVDDARITATVLSFFAFGVIGIGVREIISRVFYSLGDNKTPVINSVLIVGINVVLALLLSKLMGIRGIALATSISFLVGALALYLSSIKLIGNVFNKELFTNVIKITVASAVMALGSKFFYNILIKSFGINLSLLISIIIAGLIYLVLLIAFRVDEIRELLKLIFKK